MLLGINGLIIHFKPVFGYCAFKYAVHVALYFEPARINQIGGFYINLLVRDKAVKLVAEMRYIVIVVKIIGVRKTAKPRYKARTRVFNARCTFGYRLIKTFHNIVCICDWVVKYYIKCPGRFKINFVIKALFMAEMFGTFGQFRYIFIVSFFAEICSYIVCVYKFYNNDINGLFCADHRIDNGFVCFPAGQTDRGVGNFLGAENKQYYYQQCYRGKIHLNRYSGIKILYCRRNKVKHIYGNIGKPFPTALQTAAFEQMYNTPYRKNTDDYIYQKYVFAAAVPCFRCNVKYFFVKYICGKQQQHYHIQTDKQIFSFRLFQPVFGFCDKICVHKVYCNSAVTQNKIGIA